MAFGVVIWVFFAALCLGSVIMASGANSGPNYNNNNNNDGVEYQMVPSTVSGQERAICYVRKSRCLLKILKCPRECPNRKPNTVYKNKKTKGCLVDCSNKCETTCKYRKPNCQGYGAICYDPRFVGGDGVMFYFHGAKDKDFALLSDRHFQINAHFIGTKPEGRDRPYTWVQALGLMFDSHTLTVAAKKTSKWDETVDHFIFTFDGKEFTIPEEALVQWTPPILGPSTMTIERIDNTNNVNLIVPGVVDIVMGVAPILEKENLMHNYQLPADDVFAHLEMQFKFFNLSSEVEGVLGQTYRPGFENPVKRGVPMPIMGGEDKYATSSLLSTNCNFCKYSSASYSSSKGFIINDMETFKAECSSNNGNGGMVCRR
ncbi:hypothetical protein SUGI_1114430 [Cryptomeria japonica]|uniref:uncharacterized protein LOC131060333 n=1 Tax=Cryptomeria japonica TaxID=3369 RepID=UPI0024146F96|nr:uncharacterized protein LOC131060333 [Cryptomeria japonica]GLJ52393.1 hypothetical protein SUGI_1114430 [Cryptomeria japonica]